MTRVPGVAPPAIEFVPFRDNTSAFCGNFCRERIFAVIFASMIIRSLLLAAFFVLASASEVLACQCTTTPMYEAMSKSAAVFTGKLTKVEPDNDSKLGSFEVIKSYRGEQAVSHTLQFSKNCSVDLKLGETYLVYKPKDGRIVYFCFNPTRLFSDARNSEDLRYLESLSAEKPIHVVAGRVIASSSPDMFDASSLGIKVILRVKGVRLETTPGTDGEYSFILRKNLKYKVTILLPYVPTHPFPNNVITTKTKNGITLEYTTDVEPNDIAYRYVQAIKPQ